MISVLIRTHNDGLFLKKVLDMLHRQKIGEALEIICCDDHSSDDSPDIAGQYPDVRRTAPPDGRYIPGKTLNHLVRQARGEIIVFNNGDAIPQTEDYLQKLTAPLHTGAAEAVFANQIPRPDARPLVRKDYLTAFGDGTVSAKWDGFFSLVSSGFRRETLLRLPFDEAFQYSEDVAWIYLNKVKPLYVAEAVVEHSHNYTAAELRRRFRGEGAADRQMGKPMPSLPMTFRRIITAVLRDWCWLFRRRQWKECLAAPAYRWNQKMSYYRGAGK